MRVGLITESKYDFEALSYIIEKILDTENLEFEPAYRNGKGDIVYLKKAFSNKLKNRKCSKVLIVRDSDGADIELLANNLRGEYDSTEIKDIYDIAIAVQEMEAWFLSDVDCLKKLYGLPNSCRFRHSGVTDAVESPKEILKNFIEKESKGGEGYIESDSVRLAELLDIENATCNSSSFQKFRQTVTELVV